jgi:hypothetical protein
MFLASQRGKPLGECEVKALLMRLKKKTCDSSVSYVGGDGGGGGGGRGSVLCEPACLLCWIF